MIAAAIAGSLLALAQAEQRATQPDSHQTTMPTTKRGTGDRRVGAPGVGLEEGTANGMAGGRTDQGPLGGTGVRGSPDRPGGTRSQRSADSKRSRRAKGARLQPADRDPDPPGGGKEHRSPPAPAASQHEAGDRRGGEKDIAAGSRQVPENGTASDKGTEGGSAPDGTAGKGRERGGSGTATGPTPK